MWVEKVWALFLHNGPFRPSHVGSRTEVLYLTHSAEAPEAKFRRRNSLDEGCDALSVYTKAIPIENGYDFRCARALTAAPRPLVAPRRPGHVWIHVWIQTHEHGPPLGFKLMSRGDP